MADFADRDRSSHGINGFLEDYGIVETKYDPWKWIDKSGQKVYDSM